MESNSATDEVIVLSASDHWQGQAMCNVVLDTIFTNDEFKASVRAAIDQGAHIGSMDQLVELLSQIFDGVKTSGGEMPPELAKQREAFELYQEAHLSTCALYSRDNKPNPQAILWPNPVATEWEPSSVYEVLPVVENLGIVNKDTPIGSAGSCFAVEISKHLMDWDFNYVWKEKTSDMSRGVFMAGTDLDNPSVQFSCNWGILFNAPSFAQVAEKAFGTRQFPRVLFRVRDNPPAFSDPYREGVHFTGVEAFEEDYEIHCKAARDTLTECEVFIITLGLNECWQMIHDGSVISRNPRGNQLTSLLRHRTLSVAENVEAIQRFIDTVRAHNPGFKLIISVSPVPFLATARADRYHVITANGHSKAVLRVAAQELVERNTGVYYFPSYELVTQCTRDPWAEDERHVTDAAVARVMELFDAMFVAGGDSSGRG